METEANQSFMVHGSYHATYRFYDKLIVTNRETYFYDILAGTLRTGALFGFQAFVPLFRMGRKVSPHGEELPDWPDFSNWTEIAGRALRRAVGGACRRPEGPLGHRRAHG